MLTVVPLSAVSCLRLYLTMQLSLGQVEVKSGQVEGCMCTLSLENNVVEVLLKRFTLFFSESLLCSS